MDKSVGKSVIESVGVFVSQSVEYSICGVWGQSDGPRQVCGEACVSLDEGFSLLVANFD